MQPGRQFWDELHCLIRLIGSLPGRDGVALSPPILRVKSVRPAKEDVGVFIHCVLALKSFASDRNFTQMLELKKGIRSRMIRHAVAKGPTSSTKPFLAERCRLSG